MYCTDRDIISNINNECNVIIDEKLKERKPILNLQSTRIILIYWTKNITKIFREKISFIIYNYSFNTIFIN